MCPLDSHGALIVCDSGVFRQDVLSGVVLLPIISRACCYDVLKGYLINEIVFLIIISQSCELYPTFHDCFFISISQAVVMGVKIVIITTINILGCT